jgi:hypothetical protein
LHEIKGFLGFEMRKLRKRQAFFRLAIELCLIIESYYGTRGEIQIKKLYIIHETPDPEIVENV